MAYPMPQPMMPQPAAAPSADTGKLTHAEVRYGLAKPGGDRCAACKFYDGPNDCELVQPPIVPAGWCEKFKPAGLSSSRNGAAAQPDSPAATMASAAPPARPSVLDHGRAIAGARALHAVGHITPDERDRHIGKSQAALRRAGVRKPFGSFSPR